MDTLTLGIDVGTTNAKALLTTPAGRVVADATRSFELLTPHPGWAEQNPEDWWQGVASVSLQVMGKANARPEQIAAVGLSGQGCAATLIDSSGVVIRPSIIWMDARSEAQCEFMRQEVGERILQINGKQPGPYNFDPKLIWLQQHEPIQFNRHNVP